MRNRLVGGFGIFLALLPTLAITHPSPAQAAATLRSVLSTAGQSAYDATVNGGYFEVIQTDYAAANSGLTNMTKIGMSDATISGTCNPWGGTYLTVTDSAINIPANAYIVGFASGFVSASANSNIRLATATSYKGTYNWLTTLTAPTSGSGAKYFLFKAPATSASTRYLGIWGSATLCGSSGPFPNGAYSSSGPPWSSFSNYSSDTINLQVLYSTSDQWVVAPPTITTSVAGNVRTVFKGTPILITTSLSDDGLVTFKYNNKNIGKCASVKSVSLSATCNWKPSVQGSGRITATLRSPTAAFTSVTSSPLTISVNKRTNNR